jgi:hypothetical protein
LAESANFKGGTFNKLCNGLIGNRLEMPNVSYTHPLPTSRTKYSDTENDRKNGLRMNNEMTIRKKRFSFFADPQERKAESLPALHTLSRRSVQHTKQNLPKSATSNPQI